MWASLIAQLVKKPLEKIIKDNNMTEEEIEKLYEFFNENTN